MVTAINPTFALMKVVTVELPGMDSPATGIYVTI
jgi:hypothetical protein